MRNIVMGNTTMKRWAAILVLAALAVSASSLYSAPVKLLDYTNTFKYNQTANLDGVNWTDRTYNDAAWPGGPALLAFETAGMPVPIRTTLQDTRTTIPPGHATYFRAHFAYNSLNKAILTVTNIVDDGSILYLNGVEMYRVNVAAATLPRWTNSFAIGAASEGALSNFVYTATNLVNGDNVLSAIVLQSDTNSSDIVFGAALWAEAISPLIITTQPADDASEVNETAEFTVGVSGTSPTYLWQYSASSNGPSWTTAPGVANTATYTIASVQLANLGYYRAVVSNPANSVTSRVARLSVTSDTTPPELVSAVASETTNTILVLFDERVLNTTGTNRLNYTITIAGGTNQLVVSNAQVNAQQVRLTVQPWAQGSNYILTVNNIADLGGNVIIPNSKIGISFWKEVLPNIYTQWNYTYGTNLDGKNWTAKSFNEYTNSYEYPPYEGPWITAGGYAYFYGEFFSGLTYPEPRSTVIPAGFPTFYFRKYFVMPTNVVSTASLMITHLIDDGGAVYLNGEEILAYNMPAKPWTYNTLAATQRGTAPVPITTPVILVTNLLPGTNVIAAQMKPQSLDSFVEAGICFGLTLDAATSVSPGPVTNSPRPDMVVWLTNSPALPVTNTTFSITLTLTNRGEGLATNVQAISTFPPSVSIVSLPAGCVNASGVITCTVGTVAASNAVTRVFQVSKATLGTFTNSVNVPLSPNDKNILNNSASLVVNVTTNTVGATPDLAVAATAAPALIGVSSNYTFTFSVTNIGAAAASSVFTTNALPPGVTVVTLGSSCTNVSGVVHCSLGTIPPGQTLSRVLTLKAGSAGTLTNRVTVGSTPVDVPTSNNQASANVIAAAAQQMGNPKLVSGNVSFSYQTLVGVTYVTDYKPLLTSPTWTPVATNAGTGGIVTFSPPIPNPNSPTRFYRVRAQ